VILHQKLRIDDASFSRKGIDSPCDHDLADQANKKPERSILENGAGGQLVVYTHGAENVSTIAESKIQSRDSQAVTNDHEELDPDTSFAQITNAHKSMKRPVHHRIGTALFMAADLYGHDADLYSYNAGLYNHKGPPSYRYDLESFFLTFAWTCATFGPLDDMHNRRRKFLSNRYLCRFGEGFIWAIWPCLQGMYRPAIGAVRPLGPRSCDPFL